MEKKTYSFKVDPKDVDEINRIYNENSHLWVTNHKEVRKTKYKEFMWLAVMDAVRGYENKVSKAKQSINTRS